MTLKSNKELLHHLAKAIKNDDGNEMLQSSDWIANKKIDQMISDFWNDGGNFSLLRLKINQANLDGDFTPRMFITRALETATMSSANIARLFGVFSVDKEEPIR